VSLLAAAFVCAVALLTATLSGVFGMAGGLVLMGALALVQPVTAAFVTHGVLQLAANGWRAALHREHVRWPIIGWYALASLAAGLVVFTLSVVPSRPVLYLMLGLVPLLVWLPAKAIALDAERPAHAFLAGGLVTGLNLLAGVAGPLLDVFFVRTALTRHAIVATKAATQVFSHLAKILVYGGPLLGDAAAADELPSPWLFVVAIPLSMVGTVLGGRILDRMTDVDFKRWTRLLVTAIGALYLIKALSLWSA
jgi:uncharacterized membrane protein YfcA